MQTQNIIPFDFENNAVRIIMQDDEPWFVATDVCTILDINNPRQAITRLNEDEKGVITNDTLGGKQEMNVVNESGLYALIFSSRKPEAKRFQKWVTSEVLPSIRKTGSYGIKPNEQVQLTYRLISLQQQSWKLIKALKAETNRQARSFLYGQLESISQEMGLRPPPLEELGKSDPDFSEIIKRFWDTYNTLTSLGIELNHTPKEKLIAINLSHFCREAAKHNIEVTDNSTLKKALRSCKSPLFLDYKSVSSRLFNGRTAECHVFEVTNNT